MTALRKASAHRVLRLVLCVVLLCVVTMVNTSHASFMRARRVSAQDFSEQIVQLVNEKRRQDGKPPVCTNMKMMRASQIMANDMADSDYFAGTGDDTSSPAERVSGQKFVFTTLTEDVAAGFETPQAALDALMAAQDHRDNILGDYKFVGAGYSYGSRTGYKHFWSLHFANAINEYCDVPVEKKQDEPTAMWRRWLHL